MKTVEKLLEAAQKVKENAYAPYSHFYVGAALITDTGKIYPGCNVENTSYGLTICAERSAIFRMIADGERRIAEILVIGDTEEFLPPCGACRQVMGEFGLDTEVITVDEAGDVVLDTTVGALLPEAFQPEDLT
jgi:cytidine deaminase